MRLANVVCLVRLIFEIRRIDLPEISRSRCLEKDSSGVRQMRAVWRLGLRGFDIFLQVIRLIVKYIFGISKVTCVVEIFFNKKKGTPGILIVDKKRDGMRHYMKMF